MNVIDSVSFCGTMMLNEPVISFVVMNHRNIFSVLLMSFLLLTAGLHAEDLLSSKYSLEELKRLLPASNVLGIPKIDDRQSWGEADQEILKANFEKALSMTDYEWKPIPATVTLMFVRTGNRSVYESISFGKRSALFTFLLAELYENKGRFIDQILDGVWSICEESYWGVPAHLGQGHGGSGLPDVEDPYVDLFNAETACMLSWVDYLVGSRLEKISKHVRPRIANEIEKRLFIPAMSWDHPWMRANSKTGRRPNNWNPWICSNWLCSALLMEKDHNRKAEMVNRILDVLDEFLTPYPNDGGCDEGPGYWNAASASLYDNLELLNFATNNAFAYIYDNEKIKNMGRFIYRAQISDTYFLNFADASPKITPDGALVWRFGRDIQDEEMMRFGAYYRNNQRTGIRTQTFRIFFELFSHKEFSQTEAGLPLPKDVWLPDTEVLIARDKAGTTDGFFMAVKGGHNDESHNHNDIGNFVVYYDGLPLIIDVGSGTYTAKTFSSKRYDIWYNCSDYHNCPTINGKTQLPGKNYKAGNLSHNITKSRTEMRLDISKSYPEDAGINSCYRTVTLNRGKNVSVQDIYSLDKVGTLNNHLMTCWPVEIKSDGEILIQYRSKQDEIVPFIVKYDSSEWDVSIEKVTSDTPEDKGVIGRWGKDTIRRISLTAKQPKAKGTCAFRIFRK